jgi:aminoglycoside phosphotransferase
MLTPAVSERGGRIHGARPRFVNYRPGSRIAVRYSARVEWPDGGLTDETLVAAARRDERVGVWRWPDDPRLPGLRHALDPEFVRRLLDPAVAPTGPLRLSRRTYWPGNRSVLVARSGGERVLFVKVVRPARAERLFRLHEDLAPRLPVARCLGWSRELGVLCLEALPGETVASCVSGGAQPPDPAELVDLLLRLGDVPVHGEPRRTTAARIASHVRLLAAVLPEEAGALQRFAELYGEERPQPLTTVHGDFHDSQVLAAEGRVTGLLDLDRVGPGQLVDDLALMLARVRARARFGSRGHDRAAEYERRLLARFGAATEPAELHRRAAGALLGRATAPFRAQVPGWREAARARLRLAEASLSAARAF